METTETKEELCKEIEETMKELEEGRSYGEIMLPRRRWLWLERG